MFKVCKELSFCYSHRLGGGDKVDYKGKCSNCHGHNALVQITYCLDSNSPIDLNVHDMVIDFNIIKNTIGKWIDENWDHTMLIYEGDKELIDFCEKEKSKYCVINANASAEWMSWFIYKKAEELLKNYKNDNPELVDASVYVDEVKVWETPTSFATYTI